MKSDARAVGTATGATTDNSVLPLINVVFLLLMFFMIAGQITRSSSVDALPESASEDDIAERRVQLEILAAGEIRIDGEPVDGPLVTALRDHFETLRTSADTTAPDSKTSDSKATDTEAPDTKVPDTKVPDTAAPGNITAETEPDEQEVLIVYIEQALDVGELDPVLRAMRELQFSRLQIVTRPLR
ncbi:MAG: hypothetical protein CSB44_07640 [Gammaproteobacteria bacterium]|nr:MAG: hypothetical protein CSB44_07640 [Gammaproteobacteria bacterium]